MAILDEVPGLEVNIIVNGRPLIEYEDHTAQVSAKTIERYVKAQSGSEYRIDYSFRPPFPANRMICLIVTIDGEDVDRPMIRPFELFDQKGHSSFGPISKQAHEWGVQNYSFSAIQIDEADAGKVPDHLKDKLQSLGIITCEFYFMDNARKNHYLTIARKETEQLPSVSEKAIKGDALSHRTVLSEVKATEEIEYFDAEYADGGEPFATFHFYYRSLAALKDLHIIPRTPEPLDLVQSDDSDIGQMNREQLESMIRRFRDQEEARLCTKRERSDSLTVVGDEDDVGDRFRGIQGDEEVVMTRWVDVRAERMRKRVRQLPTPETEVIVLE